MDLDLSQYMDLYVDNSRENLDIMDRMLLALEQNSHNNEAIQEIFRAAHTLKGMSATMGFERVAQLTQKMEGVLELLKGKKIQVNGQVIDILFETFDALRISVNDSILSSDSKVDLQPIYQKLAAISGEGPFPGVFNQANAADAAISAIEPQDQSELISQELFEIQFTQYEAERLFEAIQKGLSVFLLQVVLLTDCLLKGPRVFMVLRNLDFLHCEIVKSSPPVKILEEEKFDTTFKMLITTNSRSDEIKDSIEGISEIDFVKLLPINSNDIKIALSSAEPYSEPAPNQPPVVAAPPSQPQVSQTSPSQPAKTAKAESPKFVEKTPPPPAKVAVQKSTTPDNLPATEKMVAQPTNFSPVPATSIEPISATPPTQSELDLEKERERKERELVHLVSFCMAGETYAIDISLVEGIINLLPITRVPKAPTYIEGVINMRGEVIPVINLRRRLKLTEKARVAEDQIIILHFEEQKVKVGLLVDTVREVLRLKKESIEPPSHVSEGVEIEYLNGVGKMDKKLIILLNANTIIFGTSASLKKGKVGEEYLP